MHLHHVGDEPHEPAADCGGPDEKGTQPGGSRRRGWRKGGGKTWGGGGAGEATPPTTHTARADAKHLDPDPRGLPTESGRDSRVSDTGTTAHPRSELMAGEKQLKKCAQMPAMKKANVPVVMAPYPPSVMAPVRHTSAPSLSPHTPLLGPAAGGHTCEQSGGWRDSMAHPESKVDKNGATL